MKNLYKNLIKTARNYNLYEISLFKLYIIAFTLVISILFPIVLSLELYFYLIGFILLDLISLVLLIKKEGNFLSKIFKNKNYKVFNKYSVFDFGIFKLTLVSFGLLIAKFFPVLLDVNLGIYAIVVGIGIGYFVPGMIKK